MPTSSVLRELYQELEKEMSKNEYEHRWYDVDLGIVMRHFNEEFKYKDGAKIIFTEWFVDPVKNKVIFKHFVEMKGAK